jgi:Fic family protein
MKPDDLAPDAPGRLRKTRAGDYAYIPHPIPLDLTLDYETINGIIQAERELGALTGMVSTFEDPLFLNSLLIRNEAAALNRLAGSPVSLVDLFAAELSPGLRTPAIHTAQRTVDCFVTGIDALAKKLPFEIAFLQDLYAVQTGKSGLRGEEAFRRGGGRFKPEPLVPASAVSPLYRPAPPSELQVLLYAFDKFLRRPAPMPTLVRAALLFYQFHALRPFTRFNIQLGGILLGVTLFSDGGAPLPVFTLSAYVTDRAEAFKTAFYGVAQRGDWKAWLLFFCDGIYRQARETESALTSLMSVRDEMAYDLAEGGSADTLGQLSGELFTTPAITVNYAAHVLRVTFRAAQLTIDKMVDAGVVEEITGGRRNRIYVARRVIDALSADRR